MPFLNWQNAAIAAAATIPALLLLYFLKLRRKELTVPSTLLWQKSIRDLQVNSPFQRLRRNLLLFLQLALLLALLVAFARPIAPSAARAGKLSVILIDRSASMSAKDGEKGATRLEQAQRLARDLVDTLDKDGTAMVVAFDDSAEIVQGFTSDRLALKKAIDSVRPTDRLSRLKTAFELAEAKALAFNPDQLRPQMGTRPQLWLYSDGRVADRSELSLRGAELRYTKIGGDQAGNVAIVSLSARRNYERPTEVEVFVRLANHGPEPVSAVLQLSVDGQVPPGGVKRGLTLVPERWSVEERAKAAKEKRLFQQAGAEFRMELLTAAVVELRITEQQGDVLAADDVARVVVPPPRTLGVLVVTQEGNLPLEKFLESSDLEKPQVIAPAKYVELMKDPQAVAAKYDIIFFDRYSPAALPTTGNFVYFDAVPPAVEGRPRIGAAASETGPTRVKEVQGVLDWERGHPILRGLNIQRIYMRDVLKLLVPPEAQALVDGHESTLVAIQRDGRQTHLVMAFDITRNSDWPLHSTFPNFMDNVVQYLALGSDMEMRQSYAPGAAVRIPRHSLQQAEGELRRIGVSGPDGYRAEVEAPAAGDVALPPFDRVGLYRLDPPVPQFDRIAVNLLDDNESNLVAVADSPGGLGEVIDAQGAASRPKQELWWWLIACLAVPLLLIEWWVYTRRVHL